MASIAANQRFILVQFSGNAIDQTGVLSNSLIQTLFTLAIGGSAQIQTFTYSDHLGNQTTTLEIMCFLTPGNDATVAANLPTLLASLQASSQGVTGIVSWSVATTFGF